MDNEKLGILRKKLYFTVKDLRDIIGIKLESSWVLCNRYTKKGIFIRLKNNFYVLQEKWDDYSAEDFLKICNYLQVPSYISFMTALSVYGVTTQVQRKYFESASLKRSRKFDVSGAIFNFYKLKKKYYFDFIRKDSIFIASKEKAFIDSVYLYSFGKYKLDLASLDLKKLDKARLKSILRIYPERTREAVRKLCGI